MDHKMDGPCNVGQGGIGVRRRALGMLAIGLIMVALVGFCGVASGVPMTGSAVSGMSSVDSVITDLMDDWNIPGMAVAVVKDGRLVFARGYGYVDKEAGEVVEPDSLFRIASVTKPITAVATLKLVEAGRLGLEDKAFEVLDNLEPASGAKLDSRLEDITIRHLLTHSGGWDVSRMGYDPQFDSYKDAATTLGTDIPADAETLVRYMMGKRLSFNPGSGYAYSNLGYNVLGRVIEEVTGQSYESYVKSSILRPMGITDMKIGGTRLSDRAAGEVKYYGLPGGSTQSVFPGGGRVPWPYGGWYLEAMDSHGGWIASAVDVLRFMVHVDGRSSPSDILKSSTSSTMTARPSINQWKNSKWYYALGWLVNEYGNWWHDGSLDGTSSILVRAANGLSWFAVANHRPQNWEDFNLAMDNAMWDAVNGVTRWPSHDLFDDF